MAGKVKPVPDNYHTITPSIIVKNAAKAIEFYKLAFGAEEISRMTGPGGGIMHAEIKIGDSPLMMGEESIEMGMKAPTTLGGSPGSLNVYTEDVDAAFKRAIAAGAVAEMPPADMFWGDRYAKVRDPFGHQWGLLTHIEDVSPSEMERRGQEFMKNWKKPGA